MLAEAFVVSKSFVVERMDEELLVLALCSHDLCDFLTRLVYFILSADEFTKV